MAVLGSLLIFILVYLDLLSGLLLVRRLQSWYQNVGKRLIKSPIVYIRNSGILSDVSAYETDLSLG